MHTERRFQNTLRAAEQAGGKRYLSGYAARFLSTSEDLGGFREKLAPGCFAKSLRSGDPRMLLDHDSGRLLGRMSAGTLELSEDARGLFFSCELPDTTAGRDVYESVKRGDLTGCSFGFVCRSNEWNTEPDPEDPDELCSIRTVIEADLQEVSAVAWPAYLSTSVDASQRAAALFPGGEPAEIRSHIGPEAAERLRIHRRMTELTALMGKEPVSRPQTPAERLEYLRSTL